MAYRIPEFIQLIIPLAFLLGVLLAYGRMYAESEMTVLIACGLSRYRLLGITLIVSLLFMVIVAVLSLALTPLGLANASRLLEAQEELTEFDILVPGLFQSMSQGERTTYTEAVQDGVVQNVFMHQREGNRVTVAKSGIIAEDEEGNRFIRLMDGTLTQGRPGEQAFILTRFEELGIRLPKRELNFDITVEEKAMPSTALLASGEAPHIAELQWRISLFLLVPVLTLLAIPLSRVSPREGRFARLGPAIICYITYFGLLLVSRDMVGRGELPAVIGVWWVHLLFLALSTLLFLDKLPNPLTLLHRSGANAKT